MTVRVLASAAGLIVVRAELDVTGEDFTISYKGVVSHTRHPKIEVQVKSWSRPVCRAEHWQYQLRARQFHELTGADFALPRFLVLVIVPDHWTDYATVNPDSVQLKYAAYWRSLRDQDRVELATVDLAGVVAYLRATGWRETGTYVRTVIWTRTVDSSDAEVLVPDSAGLRDYPARLAELVSTLTAVEQRPAAEVVQDLRSPTLDVQYIRMMPDGPSGSTPLHEGYLAIKGVHDLLLAAATSAVSSERPTVLPSQKPQSAKGFLDQVRLGQTTRGSYVLRVETPLPPADIEPPVSSREVLLHLCQATSAAHDAAARSSSGDSTPFIERVGDGVSANLCEALADIGVSDGVLSTFDSPGPRRRRCSWTPPRCTSTHQRSQHSGPEPSFCANSPLPRPRPSSGGWWTCTARRWTSWARCRSRMW
jgi:hypothetical protein